jgi:hypothetical protein
MTLKDAIIDLLMKENPGLLPDEAEWEADAILYRKDIYELAKAKVYISEAE